LAIDYSASPYYTQCHPAPNWDEEYCRNQRQLNESWEFFQQLGVAELRYDTGKNTRGNPKMIFEILMGDWNISKF